MAYSYKDVSRVDVELFGDRIYFSVFGKGVWEREDQPRLHHHVGCLRVAEAFSCCGMRSISHMSSLYALCEEASSQKTLKAVVRELNRAFNGGNVTFILNTHQKNTMERLGVLDRMDKIGRGLVLVQSFHNFNMRNTNHLYNWTFKGSKPKPKEDLNALDNKN